MVTFIQLKFEDNDAVNAPLLSKYLTSLKMNCKQLYGFDISFGGAKVNDLCGNLLGQFIISNPLFKIIHLHIQGSAGLTDKGFSQIVNALGQARFLEVLKIQVSDCKRVTEKSWMKLPKVLDTFNKLRICKAVHDGVKAEVKPSKGNWTFNRLANHYILKKTKTKKLQ